MKPCPMDCIYFTQGYDYTKPMRIPCRDCIRRDDVKDQYENGKCPHCGKAKQ